MPAPLIILGAAKTGLTAAAQAKQASSAVSVDLFKYDFVNLITKLVIFFVFSYVVAKIFEAIIFGQGLVVSFAALLAAATSALALNRIFFSIKKMVYSIY